MASRRRKTLPARRFFQPLPQDSCWVESDAYDRRVYRQLRSDSPSLHALEESGGMFLPHFASLLQDLFCILFKYNVSLRKESEVLPSALLNERFLKSVTQGSQYDFLREQTVLNEARAGLSTLHLGERLLGLIREEKFLNRGNMRDLWDIEQQEALVSRKLAERENADAIDQNALPDEKKKALDKAKQSVEGEIRGSEALLRHKTAQLKEDLQEIETKTRARLQAETVRVAQQLEEASEEAEAWGTAIDRKSVV